MANTNRPSVSAKVPITGLLCFVLVVLSLQLLLGAAIYFGLGSWAERGQFGDMFGAVNTLFSGLAFAALVYTLILQREQMAREHEENVKTAEAQSESQKVLADQVGALRDAVKVQTASHGALMRQSEALRLTAQAQIIIYNMNEWHKTVETFGNMTSDPGYQNAAEQLSKLKHELDGVMRQLKDAPPSES